MSNDFEVNITPEAISVRTRKIRRVKDQDTGEELTLPDGDHRQAVGLGDHDGDVKAFQTAVARLIAPVVGTDAADAIGRATAAEADAIAARADAATSKEEADATVRRTELEVAAARASRDVARDEAAASKTERDAAVGALDQAKADGEAAATERDALRAELEEVRSGLTSAEAERDAALAELARNDVAQAESEATPADSKTEEPTNQEKIG